MAKQKRTKVPGHRNIYQYEQSRLYEVRLFPVRTSPRFATIEEATAWRDVQHPPAAAATFAEAMTPPGSLASYETWYWEQIPTRPGVASEKTHLKAWFKAVVTLPTGEIRVLGKMPVREVTADLVNAISARWLSVARTGTIPATSKTKAYARSTVLKRLEVLRHYCEHLAKHHVPGLVAPTTDAYDLLPRKQKTPPITVPLKVVTAVLEKLLTLDRKTHARFAVAVITGQRPCQVGRATLGDIDLDGRNWTVHGAKGQDVRNFPLTPLACAVWLNFIAVEAWGDKVRPHDGDRFFDTTAYGKVIHAAGWPKGIKPYNARHTYARAALAAGVNLGDLQALFGHASPEITRDIYGGFVNEKTREASEKMDDYLKEAFIGLKLAK